MAKNQEHEWSSTAPTYDTNVGRLSTVAAPRLVAIVDTQRSIDAASRVLDVGAGTGAVTLHIAADRPSAHILATDISGEMLKSIDAIGHANVSTRVMDARALAANLAPRTFTHVFNTFMLQVLTDPLDLVRQMYQLLEPGGAIGIALWGLDAAPLVIWERACRCIDPTYRMPHAFDDPNAWRTTSELQSALTEAGFINVQSVQSDIDFPFSAEHFAEFWFDSKNPVPERAIESWNGDVARLRAEMIDVIRKGDGNGGDIKTPVILGAACKPELGR